MAPAGSAPVARPGLGFLAIALAVLAPAMDTSVNIAMPSLTAAFGLAQRDIQWVVICYMLTYGSLMLTCGKIGDLFGHRRVLQTGLAVCLVSFTASSLSATYPALLAGRMLQGVGIALSISCAPALATGLYPETSRTWVLSIYGALFALGTALGPIAGSWLVSTMGWSGVFAFRIPVVAAALALSVVLPAGVPAGDSGRRAATSFDWIGAGLLVTWMSAFVLAFSGPHDVRRSWPNMPEWLPEGTELGWTLAATGVVALSLFLVHELRFPEPIIRPRLFRSARFAILNTATLLVNLASFSVLLIVPYFLVRATKLPIQEAGLLLATQGLGTMAGSWMTGQLAARIPPPSLALAGGILSAAALLAIGQWTQDTQFPILISCLFAQGIGVGLFQVAYNDSVIATLPPQDRGVAGSLTMMVRTLGIIGGATGLSALFQSRTAAAIGLSPDAAFLQSFQQTLTIAGACLMTALLLSLVRASVWR